MTSVEQNENEGVNHTENDQEWFAASSQLDGTPSGENRKNLQLPKKLLLPQCGAAGGEGFGDVCQASELVAQRELNLANRADNGTATTPGIAKRIVYNAPITRAKNMAVKSVWNINLKNN